MLSHIYQDLLAYVAETTYSVLPASRFSSDLEHIYCLPDGDN